MAGLKGVHAAALGLGALALMAGAARAGIEDFSGNWRSAGRDLSGITHVVISPAGGTTVSIRIFGECHPIECNWGLVPGKGYATGPKSDDIDTVVTAVNFGFAHRQIIFRKTGPDRMSFEVFTDYDEDVGKNDFASSGAMQRSSWAGPVGQNWERPGALLTGWGGGARSGISRAPVETCTPFDSKTVKAVPVGPNWKVAAGAHDLTAAGSDERLAIRVQDTIRHYGFDRQCKVGRTVYWKHGDSFPAERMGGADCVLFNSLTVHLSPINKRWKIVDGVQWIASFEYKSDAEALIGLIRQNRLDAECFVGGRENPMLTYWLAF